MSEDRKRREPAADHDRRVIGYMGTPLWMSSQFLNFLPYYGGPSGYQTGTAQTGNADSTTGDVGAGDAGVGL